jgi:UDP-N-acetyl-2-amino-2-deoxyglucuronate dehydrogenase
MAQVGIAFIGTGFIADYHLAGLKAVPGAKTRVIVGRDAAKAASLAARFEVAESSVDLASTLARSDIDAVIIATPDDTHEAIAAQATAAGKAIMLQKPMAADVSACRRILALASAAGVDLQVSFMHRYFEEFVAARSMIAAGEIGELTSIRLRNATPGPDWADWFFKKARVAGGVVLQLGVHGIDLLTQLCGPIAAASATTAILRGERRLADGRVVPVENPDSAWATYTFTSGVVASHDMSMIEATGCDRFRMEIYGTEGTIVLRGEGGLLRVRRRGMAEWSIPALPTPPFGQRHHQRWIDGITGDAPREETARDALGGMLIAEAIARSAAALGARTEVAV